MNQNMQTSLAGGVISDEEKLRQVKKSKTQKKYRIISFSLVGIIIVSVLIFLFTAQKSLVKEHEWKAATCTTAKTCTVCNTTEGSPLGHAWIKATCQQPKICSVCNATEGSALDHIWQNATCQQPKVCAVCNATEGVALDHTWKNATCTEAETCISCGAVQGRVIGHDWKEATFLEPKTCMRCNATEGTHIPYENIDVEREIESIRTVYYDIMSDIENGVLQKNRVNDSVEVYYDARGEIRSVVVYRGKEGIGQESSKYSRSYYYNNGELIFAFFEGTDSHRLYFYDGMLMRWLYRSNAGSEYHDFDFTNRYLELERLATEESWLYQ